MPFLQATSGNPAEGTRVAVGPTCMENVLMTQAKTGSGGGKHEAAKVEKDARDNRSVQRNPNNDKYYQARGHKSRPEQSGGEPATKTGQR